jgi:hypothetical protein
MIHFILLFSVLIDMIWWSKIAYLYTLFYLLTCHLDKKSNKHSLNHNLFLQRFTYSYGKGTENPVKSVFFYKKGTNESIKIEPSEV